MPTVAPVQDPDAVLTHLLRGREARAVHIHRVEPRAGQRTPWPDWVDPDLVTAWRRAGVQAPWAHQAAAAELAWSGRHVALATGTASGKSLAFGLPALSAVAAAEGGPGAREGTVLYLAPTKALAADQARGLADLDLRWLRAATYDGDTDAAQRQWVRRHANYVLTNPDLLHHSLLPGHEAWSGFLRRLRFIVVDEAHAYRGVLGAHVAAILRRLRRVAAHYGADPTVFVVSATIANPQQAGHRLVGDPVTAVTTDTSARPGSTVVFWEPPTRTDTATRRSAVTESADLLADLALAGVQVVGFARSRAGVENLAGLVRDRVDPDLPADAVAAYRGGFLPHERRDLEADLRSGRIRALATTSALELGIDVHGLDAVVLCGWPGTRASLWQQLGRAGRGADRGLGILVARDEPLDAYVVNHPEIVLDAPVEAAVFDPANPYVLRPHLAAAAAEVPLTRLDAERWFGPSAVGLLDELTATGLLRRRPTGWFWTRPDRASDLADLRGSGPTVRIVEDGTGRLLGTVDSGRAPGAVHPGAVYTHQGVDHVIVGLDLDEAVAWARVEDVDYSTMARQVSEIRVRGVHKQTTSGVGWFGEVEVTGQVVGFARRAPDGTNLGEQSLDLPAQRLLTRAVWWTLDDRAIAESGLRPADLPGAAHAAEHASISMLPLFATCDRWDLGGVSTALHPDTGRLTVFVHDAHAGGAGFAEHGFAVLATWLAATREAISSCPCSAGCPACVQSPKCGNGNEPLDKRGAVALLGVAVNRLEDRPAH